MRSLTGHGQALLDALERDDALAAYLAAAAMSQVAADYLHPGFRVLDGAAQELGNRVLARTAHALRAAHAARPGARRAAAWLRELDTVLDALADRVAGLPRVVRAGELVAAIDSLPRSLREMPARPPACFSAFDQRPADAFALARRLDLPRGTPVLVAGVRTSGSYLAPLCAAGMRAAGRPRVRAISLRPGRALLRRERALVRAVAASGGVAVVVDDPPVTGASIAAAADQLRELGMSRTVLLLAVFGHELPEALAAYEHTVLPEAEWAVQADLEPDAVRAVLGAETVEPVGLPPRRPRRGHAWARFEARWPDGAVKDVVVEGIGIAEPPPARALSAFAAPVLAIRDGLVYREWLPEEQRVDPGAVGDEEDIAAAVARYVAQRRELLPTPAGVTLDRAGEQPVWEVAGEALSVPFGRAARPARVLIGEPVARRLLRVSRPALVDGNTDLAQWFAIDGALRKVEVGHDRFAHLGSSCHDPVFDLAGATARAASPDLPRRMRRAYAELAEDPVDPERWLLYELAHLKARGRTDPDDAPALRRARARALQRYYSDVFLADVDPPSGALCVLDVDGVLETEHLGFPALSPASATALRALMRHGYRPVLATGRSVPEVIERCRAYGLAGGVAEYGSAVYLTAEDRVEELVGDPRPLERVRAALREMDGVRLDEDYRRCIRASGARARTGAGALCGPDVRAIPGDGQIDFVAAAIDKAAGFRSLAGALGAPARAALAVGDTATDAPLAAVAARACAPRHGAPALGEAGFERMRAPYQAGLADAVARLIGHRPGGCAECRMAPPGRERRLLLGILGAQERGSRGLALSAAKLAVRAR